MPIRNKCMFMIATALILALLLGGMPAAWASGDYKAEVAVDSMKVYARKAPHKYLGSLPKGTVVTVKDTAGDVALIRYSGKTGLALISDLKAVDEDENPAAEKTVVALRETRIYKRASTDSRYTTVPAGTEMLLLGINGECAKVKYSGKVGYAVASHLGESVPVEEPAAEEETPDDTPVQTLNAPAVTLRATRIYKKPSLSSRYITVEKGTKLTVVAVKGDCAQVKYDGSIGYMAVADLGRDDGDALDTLADKFKNPFSSGSNEAVIYEFLIKNMNYNHAAACGVMANIKYESSYNPDCNGDHGTSYGICQWHAGRKTNLINYCEENGLDYTTLDAQLRFMKHELTTRYTSVHSYMLKVENTAEGAYDAGYYFCFNYEAPAARTSQSKARGNYAQNTLFNKK